MFEFFPHRERRIEIYLDESNWFNFFDCKTRKLAQNAYLAFCTTFDKCSNIKRRNEIQ